MPTDLTCGHGSVRGCVIRIAELAADGSTPSGLGLYVSDDMVEITIAPEVQDGDVLEQRTACGDYAIDFKDADRERWYNLTLKLASPNATISALLVDGFETYLNMGGDTIGGKFPPLGKVTPGNGVSIEVWSDRLDDTGQNLDGTYPYYQWALVRTRNWRRVPTPSFGNAVNEVSFVGRGFMNNNWGNGPANDWGTLDTTDTPLAYQVAASTPSPSCTLGAVPHQS